MPEEIKKEPMGEEMKEEPMTEEMKKEPMPEEVKKEKIPVAVAVAVPEIRISYMARDDLRNLLSVSPYKAKHFDEIFNKVSERDPPTISDLRPFCEGIEEKIGKPMALAELFFYMHNFFRNLDAPLTTAPEMCKIIPTWVATMIGLEVPEGLDDDELSIWFQAHEGDFLERTSGDMTTCLMDLVTMDPDSATTYLISMMFLKDFLGLPLYLSQKQAYKVVRRLGGLTPGTRTLAMYFK